MRVNISHSEKSKGLLKKTTYYIVSCDVQFSEEELHIIKTAGLNKTIVMERAVPADQSNSKLAHDVADVFNLRIFNLMEKKPNEYVLATPGEARQYEEELKERLRMLKEYIDGNQEGGREDSSFEL